MFISLGQNCASVTHYVKNKIMKKKNEGRLSCPFDLMITSYTGLCKLFNSSFEDMLKDISVYDNIHNIKYKDKYLFYSKSLNKPYNNDLICNKKLGLYFNHESPGNPILYKTEKWASKYLFTENNFKKFYNRYNDRINNLKKYINSAIKNNTIIYFILNTNVTPFKLVNIIKNKYPTLKFKILCNKIDKELEYFLTIFEKDFCNYEIIDEKKYDSKYSDNYVIMNGWDNNKNINILQL